VPLALLRPPCVLREQVLQALKRAKRPCRVTFTGSSMSSVQAAVVAGLGLSLLPRSSVLPGMRVVPRGRDFPDPGHLRVGVVRGATARADIVDALEKIIRQTLSVLSVSRPAA
jgi:DNA-binding transcriptional LysR family regulator